MSKKMSKQEAKDTIEELSRKYFATEARRAWNISGNYDLPFWNIFTLKGFSLEECRKLGEALIALAGEAK